MTESECGGENPVSAKVDRSMRNFVDTEAAQFNGTRSEAIRVALDVYRGLRRGDFQCPECSEPISVQ